jgi:hypothetical protein
MIDTVLKKFYSKGLDVVANDVTKTFRWTGNRLVTFDESEQREALAYIVKRSGSEAIKDGAAEGGFPLTPESVTLDSEQIRLLKLVAPLVYPDETRYTLTGILIEPTAIVATDGHRLVKVSTTAFAHMLTMLKRDSMILDSRILTLVSAAKKSGSVSLYDNGTSVHKKVWTVLRTNEFIFSTDKAEIDGQFPDWQQVVPDTKSYAGILDVDPSYLNSCISKPSLPVGWLEAATATKGAKLVISTSKGEEALSSNGTVTFSICGYDIKNKFLRHPLLSLPFWGHVEDTGVDSKYLAQALKAIGNHGNVKFLWNSELDPIVIEAGEQMHLIMPVRIKE